MKTTFGPGNWTLEELLELTTPPGKLPPEAPAVVSIVRDLALELKETRDLLSAMTTTARRREELLTGQDRRLRELLGRVNDAIDIDDATRAKGVCPSCGVPMPAPAEEHAAQ